MKRAILQSLAAALVAVSAFAAAAPPLAGVWNIATSGKASSSGDLAFRVTPGNRADPVDVTVPVIAGAGEESVARSIQRALAAQLPRQQYSVQLGQGANVLVSDPRGRPNFSLELVDSDIDNMRVQVQSVTPSASPTVPAQAMPAEPPANAPPAGNTIPGNAVPGNAPPPATSAPAPAGVPAPGNSAPSPGAVPAPGMGVPVPPNNAPVPNPNVPVPSTPTPSPSAPVPESSTPPGTAPAGGMAPANGTAPANGMGAGGAPASAPPPPGS